MQGNYTSNTMVVALWGQQKPKMSFSSSCRSTLALLIVFISFFVPALALDGYVSATIDGEQVMVKDNRRPSLYTADFGDCMGSSSINVTRFDAAYYKDNMTVLFHLAGDSTLKNESIMSMVAFWIYISL